MIAGASLIESPALGSLRLVRDEVVSCMDPDDVRPGLLVQEYDEIDDYGRATWQTVCPLTDVYFMLPLCPMKWYMASVRLREMIERGEAVTLADELAAMKQ